MLFLPVLFLLPAVLCGVSAVESPPTYEHQDPLTGKILRCDKCPPGTHMAAHCTATKPTQCLSCRENHFTDLWNYLPKCLYCKNLCNGNQEVERECSPVSDRVCRCKEGFYLFNDFCMAHSECGPGEGVKTKGTSQLDTVCEKCPDGYFSSSSSATESCVKQQECPCGQTVLLPGSIYHNTLCGSCEDFANGGETPRKFYARLFSMHKLRKLRKFVARYIRKSGEETLPKHKGPLLDEIREWLDKASVEELKKLPEMLKTVQLNTMTEKLEKRLDEIEQTLNCSLSL